MVLAFQTTTALEPRLALIDAIGQTSSAEALPLLRNSLKDSSPEVQRGAILALTGWTDAAPLADLTAAAKTDADPALQILSLRGCLKLIALRSERPARETAKLLADLMPLAKQPAEKKAVWLCCRSTLVKRRSNWPGDRWPIQPWQTRLKRARIGSGMHSKRGDDCRCHRLLRSAHLAQRPQRLADVGRRGFEGMDQQIQVALVDIQGGPGNADRGDGLVRGAEDRYRQATHADVELLVVECVAALPGERQFFDKSLWRTDGRVVVAGERMFRGQPLPLLIQLKGRQGFAKRRAMQVQPFAQPGHGSQNVRRMDLLDEQGLIAIQNPHLAGEARVRTTPANTGCAASRRVIPHSAALARVRIFEPKR